MYLYKTLGLVGGVMLLLNGCGGGVDDMVTDMNDSDGYISTYSTTYKENVSLNLLNPDRGFYDADYELNRDRDYNMFEDVKSKGYSMVYAPINLEDYVDTPTLPSSLLDTIKTNLKNAQESGVKLIFRIKYRSDMDSDDASRDVILEHLKELKPILQEYKDTISVVQAGVIGAWGEWHSFSGDYSDESDNYLEHRREIIEKLVDIFPNKYIQIRTPMHKEQLFGSSKDYGDATKDAMITPDIAFSSDIRAKIGHHNDCVLADKSDMGTYISDNIEFWKDYVKNDTKYAPVGGESCGIGSGDEAKLSSCENALNEFKSLQYSYLNDAYHPDVLKKWRDEGCYDEIKYNLGYRFVVDKFEVLKAKNVVSLKLKLANKGFASTYVDYDTYFILKSQDREYRFKKEDINLQTIKPNSVESIDMDISLDDIESGEYSVYLELSKGNSYVRLTNDGLWDSDTHQNRLISNIPL